MVEVGYSCDISLSIFMSANHIILEEYTLEHRILGFSNSVNVIIVEVPSVGHNNEMREENMANSVNRYDYIPGFLDRCIYSVEKVKSDAMKRIFDRRPQLFTEVNTMWSHAYSGTVLLETVELFRYFGEDHRENLVDWGGLQRPTVPKLSFPWL